VQHCPVPLLLASANDMQGLSRLCTSLTRGATGLAGALPGLHADDEDDDDGNASGSERNQQGRYMRLRDAWTDGVLDSLPEDATPRQKAEAFAQAICDDFQGKGEKALSNVMGKAQGADCRVRGRTLSATCMKRSWMPS
jgi:hypothetical protein